MLHDLCRAFNAIALGHPAFQGMGRLISRLVLNHWRSFKGIDKIDKVLQALPAAMHLSGCSPEQR